MRTITLEEWRSEAREARERARLLGDRFPRPYQRQRPRDRDEARLLRERGTPERVIGPERG